MSTPRLTELIENEIAGSEYIASVYDNNIGIAGPKQFSITTGAKKATLKITVKAPAAATLALNTALVIGTGGSAADGAAVTFAKRDQADTSTPLTALKQDYVLGSSGQSAGTAVQTDYVLPNVPTVMKYKLKAATIYGLVFTTIADNNIGQFIFELDEA